MNPNLAHLDNDTIEKRLTEIAADTRLRPPTRDEHGTYVLYYIELVKRGHGTHKYYRDVLRELSTTTRREGYTDPNTITRNYGL